MKRIVLSIAFLFLICTAVYAGESYPTKPTQKKIIHKTVVVNNIEDDHESFDYGEYLDLVCYETTNSEWGFKLTHLNESNESRVYVGGKVYLNRLWKKD